MSDRTWINKKERYEVIPERELNALKAKNTALVEAVWHVVHDVRDVLPDGGYRLTDNEFAALCDALTDDEQALAAEKEEA